MKKKKFNEMVEQLAYGGVVKVENEPFKYYGNIKVEFKRGPKSYYTYQIVDNK